MFWRNADLLSVDLSIVDIAVLSHGHYNHGGGIQKFLTLNKTAKIYMSKYAFGDFYNGTEKYIGLDKNLRNSNRLVFCEDYLKLNKGLELFSQNGSELTTPIDSAGLKVKKGSDFLPDDFAHEHYLKIAEDGKTYLISGCSHKGILNIVNWFRPKVLIRGFLLMKQDAEKGNSVLIIEKLNEFNIAYYICHCSIGLEQYKILKESMTNNLNYIATGQKIEF